MARNALLGMAQLPTLQYRPETQVESLGKATQAVGGLQGIEMRQMELEKAKQDAAMLQQFRQTMMQAGKNPDPSIYGQALIQTGRPELVTKGSEIMRAVQSEAALKQELGGYQNRLAQGDARGVAQSMAVSPTPGMAQRAQALTRTLPPEQKPVDTRPKPEKVQLGDRVVFLDMNPSSPTFRQEVISQRVGAAPESPGAAEARRINQFRADLEAQRLEFQQKQAAAQAARDAARDKRDAAAADRAQAALDQAARRLEQIDAQILLAERRFETESKRLSPAAEKVVLGRQQQAADIDLTVKELEAAVAKGGLIDQSTGSIAGAAADVAAATMGIATKGSIAIGKLQPIADMVLKTVPRFEGPQSDKDTQSYKEAAGQLANPNVPGEIRKEAAKTIIRLMKERKGQFGSLDEAAAAARSGRGAVGGEAARPAPPQQAIDALLRGAGTDAQFDEIFGPGAAARARGR